MPGVANVHLPSQLVVALVGTPVQVGAEPIQTTAAGVFASWSVNMTSPPAAIVIFSEGSGFAPEPDVQHGHSASTQFWLTSSFASDGLAASAGSTATAAPNSAARAKSKSVREPHREPTFLVLDVRMANRWAPCVHGGIPAVYPLKTPARRDPSRCASPLP